MRIMRTYLRRLNEGPWWLMLFSLLIIYQDTIAQNLKETSGGWYIPAYNTKINGVAGGLIINGLKEHNDSTVTTIVNGLSFELLGLGLILPIAPSSPIYTEADSVYNSEIFVDSVVRTFDNPKYIINGLSISTGGVAGYNVEINGVNLSGLNTLTSKMTGFSGCIMFKINGVVNGLSIAGMTNTVLFKSKEYR